MIFNAKIIEQMRLKHISHNLPGRLRLFLDAISNNIYVLFFFKTRQVFSVPSFDKARRPF